MDICRIIIIRIHWDLIRRLAKKLIPECKIRVCSQPVKKRRQRCRRVLKPMNLQHRNFVRVVRLNTDQSRILEKQKSLEMSQVFCCVCTLGMRWFCFSRILKAGPRNGVKLPHSRNNCTCTHKSENQRSPLYARNSLTFTLNKFRSRISEAASLNRCCAPTRPCYPYTWRGLRRGLASKHSSYSWRGDEYQVMWLTANTSPNLDHEIHASQFTRFHFDFRGHTEKVVRQRSEDRNELLFHGKVPPLQLSLTLGQLFFQLRTTILSCLLLAKQIFELRTIRCKQRVDASSLR